MHTISFYIHTPADKRFHAINYLHNIIRLQFMHINNIM